MTSGRISHAFEGLDTILCGNDLVAAVGQVVRDHPLDPRIVFDDQDTAQGDTGRHCGAYCRTWIIDGTRAEQPSGEFPPTHAQLERVMHRFNSPETPNVSWDRSRLSATTSGSGVTERWLRCADGPGGMALHLA
jgi:hypothetical protein